jgi:hypothetical protein
VGVGVGVGVGVWLGKGSLQLWYCVSSHPILSVTTTNNSWVPDNSVGISIINGTDDTPVSTT